MADRDNITPKKKNPRGKFVGSMQKMMIVNLYKDKMARQKNDDSPKILAKEMIKQISEEIGIGQRTVSVTLSEYRKKGSVTSPKKIRIRPSIIDKVDDFDQNAIRRKVYEFWHNRQIPTINKIILAVNQDSQLPNFSKTSLRRLLKHLNFEYVKKCNNSVLIEKPDIVNWRRRYLENIRAYRMLGKPIYYIDLTWVNVGETGSKSWVNKTEKWHRDTSHKGRTTGQKEPTDKGKRLIVVHIASSDGFVPGCMYSYESGRNILNYHDEINSDTFYDWFTNILPLLKENAIIVMDNASYQSVKRDPLPVISWKKKDIINWLKSKGEIIDRPMVKTQLLEMVKVLKPSHHDQYIIDEAAEMENKTVLRLPPLHGELNPIKLAWSSVKNYVCTNNITFKLNDVKNLLEEGVNNVTPDMWKNYIKHTSKEEEKLWQVDFLSDEIMEEDPRESHILTITDDTTSDSDVSGVLTID